MAQRTRNDKIQLTGQLVDRLKQRNVVYLTDFTGLSVKHMTELRRRIRESGASYIVVKNRLATRALKELELPDIGEHLQGPTGLVVTETDPVSPAKTLRDFAKENDDKPVFKVGIVDRQIVSVDEILRLADLPPKDQLIAGIAGSLTAPVAGIVGVLHAVLRDVTYMIGEVAKKNEAASS